MHHEDTPVHGLLGTFHLQVSVDLPTTEPVLMLTSTLEFLVANLNLTESKEPVPGVM